MFGKCSIALIAMTVSVAAADVIVFENTNPALAGPFWPSIDGADFPDVPDFNEGIWINPTQDASNQPTGPSASEPMVGIKLEAFFGSNLAVYISVDQPENNPTLVAGEDQLASVLNHPAFVVFPVLEFEAGDTVGPEANWDEPGTISTREGRFFCAAYNTLFEGCFFEGVFTMGVRMEIDGNTHYGFVTGEIIPEEYSAVFKWRPIRWGYETEPNVPAVVPSSCLADTAEPYGTLNFFDVSAYVTAYNAQDASADIAEPFGTFNFFDVSAYISAYNAGCP